MVAVVIPSEGRVVRKLLGLLVACVWAASLSAADVPELVKKLKSKDNEVRREAAKDLGELGKEAKPAVGALTKALKDEDRFVRRWSAEALGKIGPDAKESIPALEKLLDDGNQPVRDAAIKAIAKMGPDALKALSGAVKKTSDVQEVAVPALAELGEPAAPALSEAIKDGKMNAALRRKAVAAIVKMGKPGHVAVPSLAATAKNPMAGGQDGNALRMEAIAALGKLATTSDKAAVTVLDDLAKAEKGNKQVKDAATKALQAIQSNK
jgi:HEAT repeat protein